MLTADVVNQETGETVEFSLPANLYEWPLSRYVNFLVANRKAYLQPNALPMLDVLDAVCAALGVGRDHFSAVPVDSDSGGASVQSVYAYFSALVSGHTPKANMMEFEHGGQTYCLTDRLTQAQASEKLTVIEVIEAYEVQRLSEVATRLGGDPAGDVVSKMLAMALANAEKIESEEAKAALEQAAEDLATATITHQGDPNGSYYYSTLVKTCAILYRRSGEQLPFDDLARDRFIEQRARELVGISAGIALDVAFFLTNTFPLSAPIANAVGSLKSESLRQAVRMHSKSKQNYAPSLNTSEKTRNYIEGLVCGA